MVPVAAVAAMPAVATMSVVTVVTLVLADHVLAMTDVRLMAHAMVVSLGSGSVTLTRVNGVAAASVSVTVVVTFGGHWVSLSPEEFARTPRGYQPTFRVYPQGV